MSQAAAGGFYALRSAAFSSLLVAQFLSAMADNMLFVAAIALLKAQPGGAQWMPLVQASFVAAFVLLAPFVGPLADHWPKGSAMFRANLLKLAAALAMAAGLHPLAAYAVAGVGAAAYSPAKYGILTQMVGEARLVRANGWLEATTIVAILLGVVAGGWLTDRSLTLALGGVCAIYGAAALSNLLIPVLPPVRTLTWADWPPILRDYWRDLRRLWRETAARLSLMGTSLFWGAGATLRVVLFVWVPVALHNSDNSLPANLMGLMSVGIVIGALSAGHWLHLSRARLALWGGLAMGPLIFLLAPQTHLVPTALLLVALGAAGGFFVIPFNALLQERGQATVGVGRSLAVQNFFENLAMLLGSLLYFGAEKISFGPVAVVYGFGVLVLLGMVGLGVEGRKL